MGKRGLLKFQTREIEIEIPAFSGIHTEHTILQVGFTLLWKDQCRSNFYYCYYQNLDLGLTQVLCHKPSSSSLCSLIHEVPQSSYFNNSLAGITAGFFNLAHYSCSRSSQASKIFPLLLQLSQQLPFYSSLLHFSVTLTNCALLFASLNPVFHLKETKMCETSLN